MEFDGIAMIAASAMAIGGTGEVLCAGVVQGSMRGGSARLAPKSNVLAASFGARKCLLFGFICSNAFLVSIYFLGSCLGVCCPLGANFRAQMSSRASTEPEPTPAHDAEPGSYTALRLVNIAISLPESFSGIHR